jgi:uncharacterized membrane protein (DUF485 family)
LAAQENKKIGWRERRVACFVCLFVLFLFVVVFVFVVLLLFCFCVLGCVCLLGCVARRVWLLVVGGFVTSFGDVGFLGGVGVLCLSWYYC